MSLPYLKIPPEETIEILEKWIIKAFRIKTWMENARNEFARTSLWNENSRVIEAANNWQKELVSWFQGCESDLFKIYVSPREVYNFGGLSSFVYSDKDMAYTTILNAIDSKIAILNKYTDFIFDRFNIKVSVQADRDAIVQTGQGAFTEVNNGN